MKNTKTIAFTALTFYLILHCSWLRGCKDHQTDQASQITGSPDQAGISPENMVETNSTGTADATGSNSQIRIDQDLYLSQIQDGAYVITHSFPWAAHSLLVQMKDQSLVLVDTPYTPEATRQVLEWSKDHFGVHPIIAINTGYHHDNLGGNRTLIDQGIPVYGSDLTIKLLKQKGDDIRRQTLDALQECQYQRFHDRHKSIPYDPPTHSFPLQEGLDLSFQDETVQVYFPGPTHAPDNVVVYFPTRKILFGGCMIIGWDGMGNTTDADLEAWPKSIQNLMQFDADIIVPGHGPRLDANLRQHTLNMLAQHTK
ncbi:MAG: MBL fold metallo-hydrolase [Sedimentisphaerales bacterium]|nr:MBL fold metallo-hydrolase [Sedimentisphaerales bacterium]